MNYKILVINPGSTTTKISVFSDDRELFTKNIEHDQVELKACDGLLDQLPMRKKAISEALDQANVSLESIQAVACRGGTFGSVEGGAYVVDEALAEACRHPKTNHPSNLAAIIGYEIMKEHNIPAYIYDAVCVNETQPMAAFTGLKELQRKPNSHVLNTRAVCRKIAEEQGRVYTEMNFVTAHIGGGISLNVHEKGRIIDVVSDDEGPMSPERAGCINAVNLAKLCYSGKYDGKTMEKKLKGEGGLISHLGTSSVIEVEKRIDAGDEHAKLIFETMAYQIAKGIGAMATVVSGKVDCIVLTGGAAHSTRLTDLIAKQVSYIADVRVVPGAMEMQALADGICRVLQGREQARYYKI